MSRWNEFPAAMPATCVPWPRWSPDPVAPALRITLAVTREPPSAPLKSGLPALMPESMTATPMPLPVMPAAHSLSAPTVFG